MANRYSTEDKHMKGVGGGRCSGWSQCLGGDLWSHGQAHNSDQDQDQEEAYMIVIYSSPGGGLLQQQQRWRHRWRSPGCCRCQSASGRWTWRRCRWLRRRRMLRGGAGGAAGSCCSLLHLCCEEQKKRPVVSQRKTKVQRYRVWVLLEGWCSPSEFNDVHRP